MRLTTKSRYGLRMVIDLAMHAETHPVPLSDIAARQNISLKYLEKLISKLRSHGVVESRRGAHGGHFLGRSPEDITVGDIVRILEETAAITDCAEDKDKMCGNCQSIGNCLSNWVWVEASKALFDRLDQITISQLTENRTQIRQLQSTQKS